MDKKILIIGNMANDGYNLCKELRKTNIDVTLGMNTSDFGMSYPEWEDADLDKPLNPYHMNHNQIKSTMETPTWIETFEFELSLPYRKLPERLEQLQKLRKLINKFDIVEAHAPYSIACYFTKTPYITCDEGWIRTLTVKKQNRTWRDKLVDNLRRSKLIDNLGRRSYSKSKHMIIKNPDTRHMFNADWIKNVKTSFIPFAIDCKKYKPLTDMTHIPFEKKKDEMILSAPARQDWDVKGNDKMLKAYARFIKVFPNSKLIIPAWGKYCFSSIELISSLRINDKIRWITPVPKNLLIQYYNFADIVLDQFLCGCWGTATPEAMACGTPVLLSFGEDHIDWAFGEQPPIFSVFSEDEIYAGLIKLATDVDYRLTLGSDSRKWIKKTHDSKIVTQQHLDLWEKTLSQIQ